MESNKSIIDCKGLNCPIPIVNTKKYFDEIEQGEAIIIVDNEVAKNNIIKFSEGNKFIYEVEEKSELFYITIIKGDTTGEIKIGLDTKNKNSSNLTIVVGSDKLGCGDDELGIALMKSYLFALSEANTIPKSMIFLNSGVKLVADNELTLDSLKKLKERGVNIESCGLCLDFYGLKDKLQVGGITNMYDIIEIMNNSDTIKL
ncbi:MAG: sulfurtransferase-like selenium metabolism protein YedF [Clostridium sp.]|uniref:sulfurtransferase-like selenium metabolism protein YedF n=1 Tax=Clostridium sp. TaxID=1506 RepID=UPI003057F9ED